jgi:hypothetical protein
MTIPHIPDKVLVAENRALQNPYGISGLFAESAEAGSTAFKTFGQSRQWLESRL